MLNLGDVIYVPGDTNECAFYALAVFLYANNNPYHSKLIYDLPSAIIEDVANTDYVAEYVSNGVHKDSGVRKVKATQDLIDAAAIIGKEIIQRIRAEFNLPSTMTVDDLIRTLAD
jgi:hypothetical protein